MALKATVKGGRLVLDEPTDLPDGTVLDLVADDESGDTDAADLARINAALAKAATSIDSGRHVDGNELISRLEAKSS
jgi:hypothetical protein